LEDRSGDDHCNRAKIPGLGGGRREKRTGGTAGFEADTRPKGNPPRVKKIKTWGGFIERESGEGGEEIQFTKLFLKRPPVRNHRATREAGHAHQGCQDEKARKGGGANNLRCCPLGLHRNCRTGSEYPDDEAARRKGDARSKQIRNGVDGQREEPD